MIYPVEPAVVIVAVRAAAAAAKAAVPLIMIKALIGRHRPAFPILLIPIPAASSVEISQY